MKKKIKILDENTANKIAAGEVVERPSSVVKELVENSIDAGSTKIEVRITGGGIECIQVSDDGSGMSLEDAKLSFVRHATSKIQAIDDLEKIYSLGFRGEALPSIASVSKFTLTTRENDEEFAAKIVVEGGKMLDVENVGASKGTVIKVEDLFFNVPARRKFLKTLSTEGNHVSDVVGKMAVAHPEIAFKLYNNNKEVISTTGNNDLGDVLFALYGDKVAKELLFVDYDKQGLKISGCIGRTSLYKSNRAWQSVFVNGRSIGNRVVAKALDNAYSSLLPRGRHPFAVIKISIATEMVDINVHPQKSEVRFRDESAIYKAVYGAVLNTLNACFAAKSDTAAAIERMPTAEQRMSDFSTREIKEADDFIRNYMKSDFLQKENEDVKPVDLNEANNAYQLQVISEKFVLESESVLQDMAQEKSDSFKAKELFNAETAMRRDAIIAEEDYVQPEEELKIPRVIGQFACAYIIAQTENELYLFDQHAVHERVLYDSMQVSAVRMSVQPFVTPIFITLPVDECEFLLNCKDNMADLGIIFGSAGENILRFESLPVDIKAEKLNDVIAEVVNNLSKSAEITGERVRHVFLQSVSCINAVKAGEILSMLQMQIIIDEFFVKHSPPTCPHGRPVIKKFSQAECEKMFGRR